MAIQYEFQRKEYKYLLHTSLADRLCEECFSAMGGAERKTYTIRSLYYDNHQWQCFYDQVFKKLPRFKIRFRQYADEGGNFTKGFFEMKMKTGPYTVKQRFWCYPEWISQLEEPVITDRILRLNLGNRNLPKAYHSILEVVRNCQLSPVLQVGYQRISLENSELRLTLDFHLHFSAVRDYLDLSIPRKKHLDEAFSVLEIKTMGELPEWLKEFYQLYGIRKRSFSKYSFGVSALYDPLRHYTVAQKTIPINDMEIIDAAA